MLAVHTRIDQGAYNAAGRGPRGGANGSRRQLARGHDGAEARDCE